MNQHPCASRAPRRSVILRACLAIGTLLFSTSPICAEAAQEAELVGECEVCAYVIKNKEQHQPYLCRGLKDPSYQKTCVQVLESLMWWLTNEVYWLNYGCERSTETGTQWVRPCPSHAVCSWLENLYTHKPYCPADPNFVRPEGFPSDNVVPGGEAGDRDSTQP